MEWHCEIYKISSRGQTIFRRSAEKCGATVKSCLPVIPRLLTMADVGTCCCLRFPELEKSQLWATYLPVPRWRGTAAFV